MKEPEVQKHHDADHPHPALRFEPVVRHESRDAEDERESKQRISPRRWPTRGVTEVATASRRG